MRYASINDKIYVSNQIEYQINTVQNFKLYN